MRDPSLTEKDYLKTWALFALCSIVGGFIARPIVGVFLGLVLEVAGIPMITAQRICSFAGGLVGLSISYLFFRIFVADLVTSKLEQQRAATPPPLP